MLLNLNNMKPEEPKEKEVVYKFPGVIIEKKEAPPGKRLPITPAEFLESIGEGIEINQDNPM